MAKLFDVPDINRHRADPIWDAWIAAFGLDPVTKGERVRVNGHVRDLKLKRAVPVDIMARIAAYRKTWPKISCTPEAVLKHWDELAGKPKTAQEVERERVANIAREETRQRAAWAEQNRLADAAEHRLATAYFATLAPDQQERYRAQCRVASRFAPKDGEFLEYQAVDLAWRNKNANVKS